MTAINFFCIATTPNTTVPCTEPCLSEQQNNMKYLNIFLLTHAGLDPAHTNDSFILKKACSENELNCFFVFLRSHHKQI